ncbi:hypothetical protein NKJ06_25685, partial [Mesorhizobium sp. M0293]
REDGQTPFCGACTCGISIHSKLSPDSPAFRGTEEPRFRKGTQLPKSQNIDMSHAMEELFGDPAYKGFVLQDRKRLPSRFSARVSGALTSRLP